MEVMYHFPDEFYKEWMMVPNECTIPGKGPTEAPR